MFMVCLDWWVLEVMVLLSGLGSSSGIQVRSGYFRCVTSDAELRV